MSRYESKAIERTTQVATIVDHLTDAWAFVMEHLDEVGPDPRITISPISVVGWSEDAPEYDRQFEVSVSGMVSTPIEVFS